MLKNIFLLGEIPCASGKFTIVKIISFPSVLRLVSEKEKLKINSIAVESFGFCCCKKNVTLIKIMDDGVELCVQREREVSKDGEEKKKPKE